MGKSPHVPMSIGVPFALALAFALIPVLGPASVRAQDLVVSGCDERQPGEVGVGSLQASIGQTVAVPVSLHAVTNIEAFLLQVDFPPGVLSYVRTDPGNLIGTGDWLNGNLFPADHYVRIAGITASGSPIPAGASGTLATVVFQVTAAGVGEFGTSNLADQLLGYVSCEDAHGTSAVAPSPWGRVKAAYR